MSALGSLAVYLNLLFGGTIFISILMMVLLYKSKSIGNSRYFLMGIIFIFIMQLNSYLLFTSEVILEYPYLLGIAFPGLFLIGPFFYLFAQKYSLRESRLKLIEVLHFIPFVFVFISQLPFYFKTRSEKLNTIVYLYEYVPDGPLDLINYLISNLFIFSILIYVSISIKYFDDLTESNKQKLVAISYGLLALSVSHLIMQSGFGFIGINAVLAEIILAILFSLSILLFSFFVVEIKTTFSTSLKYRTSSLKANEQIVIRNKLNSVLQEDKLYLKKKLKISEVSKVINIPSHHISQTLNEKMGTNFNDLINEYRIEEAKELLYNDKHHQLSIEAIGDECGFNNKSSFYRAFKKFTGFTPTEFLKRKIIF